MVSNSVFRTMGATSHGVHERDLEDYYATHPNAIRLLLDKLCKDGIHLGDVVYECAVGGGHIADVLKEYGYTVICSDIVDRGYIGTNVVDFLSVTKVNSQITIMTNPPFKLAQEFTEHGLSLVSNGCLVLMMLRIQFLEGKARRKLFEKYPPKYVYVYSERQSCAKGGDFGKFDNGAACYGWFIWEKGFVGDTVVRWI